MFCRLLVVSLLSLGVMWSQVSYGMETLVEKPVELTFGIELDEQQPNHDLDASILQDAVKNMETLSKHLEYYHVDACDNTGSTLLHHAVKKGNTPMVEALVKKYAAKKDVINIFQQSPLNFAHFWHTHTFQPCFIDMIEILNTQIHFYND